MIELIIIIIIIIIIIPSLKPLLLYMGFFFIDNIYFYYYKIEVTPRHPETVRQNKPISKHSIPMGKTKWVTKRYS